MADEDRVSYGSTTLVVAKPYRLGRLYEAGQRFRPDREALSKRRVRQLVDQGVLVTEDEYIRRHLRKTPQEPQAPQEPSGDWIDELSREQLFAELRELGDQPGGATRTAKLRERLREALQ